MGSSLHKLTKFYIYLKPCIHHDFTYYAKYFIGKSYLSPVSTEQVKIYNVTFEPKCRNNWHIHRAKSGGGQILIAIGGRGYYQEWGKEPVEMKPGDVINIPATTAMETLNPQGRTIALQSGANVVMPNVTTKEYRKKYEIYPNKICINENPAQCFGCISGKIKSIGRTVSTGYGSHKKDGI